MEAEAFREKFGVELPAALVEAFRRAKPNSRYFTMYSFEAVLDLKGRRWCVPLRFIPLMYRAVRGDLLGFYYPRSRP